MAEKEKKKNVLVPILIIVLVLVIAAAAVIIVKLLGREDESTSLNWTSENGIGYEVNAKVYTSGDIAYSQPEGVAIRFKTVATSDNGTDFACEIGNSTANMLDMYIDIYDDIAMEPENEIYLSGLMRPGEQITSFKTNRQMPKGSYDVVLVTTLVEEDHKTIHAQSSVALTLIVN